MSLNGIDISNYQAGIDLSVVPCDFVIIKATQGTTYTSPSFSKQMSAADAHGKLTGVYHYINGAGAEAQAAHFFSVAGNRAKKSLICLDWQGGSNSKWGDTNYLKKVYDATKAKFGVDPVVYTSASIVNSVKFVLPNAKLWVAQYANYNITGYQNKPWNEGKYECIIRQYASTGRLNGYAKNLDLDKFYGSRDDWNKYANVTTKTEAPKTNTSTKTSTVKKPAAKPTPRLDLQVQCMHRGRSGKKVGGGEINMYDDAIVGLSIGVTYGSIEYRVHTLGGRWLGKVTKCDWGAPDCYAGDLKHMIDAVQIYFNTDTKKTGGKYYRVEYQVKTQKRGWLGKIYDTNWEANDGKHTAGVFGDPIIGIRARIVPA